VTSISFELVLEKTTNQNTVSIK